MRAEYLASDDYKEKLKKDESAIKAAQKKLWRKIVRLRGLDLNDHVALLNWIVDIQPLTDRTGVNAQSAEIVNILEHAGYKSNVNTGKDLDREDPDNFARYIVGRTMLMLTEVGAIHHVIGKFVSEWKRDHLK